MSQPVRFSPDVEDVKPDERETIQGLDEQFRQILDITSKDYGHAVRAVHAKAHGIVHGTLTVKGGLPPELAQGLFAKPGKHEAVLRISTNAGDLLPDAIHLPRGLALKVLQVEGERLPGSEGDSVQDFVMANAPAFAAPDAAAFLKTVSLLSKTTDKSVTGKKVISSVLRGAEVALEAVGIESPTLQTLGGAPQVHPLGETYYSQTPYRFGDYIAKWQLAPVSPALIGLSGETIDASGRPDALRQEVDQVLVDNGGRWELRVQLCTDLDAMPIEDATVQWDEAQSPYRTVATIDVPPQSSWSEDEKATDDALSFAPWHGIAAHRPLGSVNRARREPYAVSAEYRAEFNGCPVHQPRVLADLP